MSVEDWKKLLAERKRVRSRLAECLKQASDLQASIALLDDEIAAVLQRETWRGMLKHPHADGFRKAAEFEYETLMKMGTFTIVPKTSDQTPIPLMWVFTYKFDPDGYLHKYKARLVVRGDLEEVSVEDVYAATLTIKIFRCLVALIPAFDMKTRQFDTIYAFLNAKADRTIHVYMPDGFAIDGKCLLLVRALYRLRKSPLLWLRELSTALVSLGLQQIPGEPCLFTDHHGIILFFYVNDIVFIGRQ